MVEGEFIHLVVGLDSTVLFEAHFFTVTQGGKLHTQRQHHEYRTVLHSRENILEGEVEGIHEELAEEHIERGLFEDLLREAPELAGYFVWSVQLKANE